MGSERDASTGGGNYAENIGGHYIQANQVVINPPAATTRTETLPPIHENNGCAKRLAFAIAGTVDQADEAKLQAILQLLRKLAGDDSIEIVDIQEGSIKLILSGSPEGLERLKALFDGGELTEILETPVEAVQFVEPETSDNTDEQENATKSRLIDAIRTGGAGQDLRGRDLNGLDLTRAKLTRANLNGANLTAAKLTRAKLTRANLTGADLTGADLIAADLTAADLTAAKLNGANLNGANLNGANLTRADLNGADLNGANLTRATLNGADLTAAKLTGANLNGADLPRANLNGADLTRATLNSADLTAAKLNGADLTAAKLNGADLNGAEVIAATFTTCQGISEAEQEGLKRRGAIFADDPGDRSSTYELIPR